MYDPGVDILDGGTQVGFKLQNCFSAMPKIRTYASTDVDFMPPNSSTNVYAKAIYADDSPVVGAQVTFKIIEGSGSLSQESGITDDTGVAVTRFTGGVAGEFVKIKIKILTPCGCRFEHLITIWFKIPPHDQGNIGGN